MADHDREGREVPVCIAVIRCALKALPESPSKEAACAAFENTVRFAADAHPETEDRINPWKRPT